MHQVKASAVERQNKLLINCRQLLLIEKFSLTGYSVCKALTLQTIQTLQTFQTLQTLQTFQTLQTLQTLQTFQTLITSVRLFPFKKKILQLLFLIKKILFLQLIIVIIANDAHN